MVAPLTLITALMYYFGLQHAHWYFYYFGVNHTVMGFSTQDYLLRSADGLFVPLTALAATGLSALWIFRATASRLSEARRPIVRRAGAASAGLLGIAVLAAALIGLLRPDTFEQASALPGLCLAAGVLLLALASNLHWLSRDRERTLPGWLGFAEWGALFVVVGIGLFWSVTNYSAAVGEIRAYNTALQLSREPRVIIYSQDRLGLPGLTAREVVCSQPEESDDAYRFRYEGLTLVLATDKAWFFLPSDWPGSGGVAIVLPRTETTRFEFLRSDFASEATC